MYACGICFLVVPISFKALRLDCENYFYATADAAAAAAAAPIIMVS